MKKHKDLSRLFLAIFLFFMFIGSNLTLVYAGEGPLFYIIPAGNSNFIILGDTPRTIYGFKVWRKDPGSREFRLLTPEEIKPVNDPYEAQQIIGRDYPWVARKVGTDDPVLLWQRLRGDRTLTLLLCLVSHNLRVAMGRTYIDIDGIKPGNQYTYRIELINSVGKVEITRVKTIKAGEAPIPPPPQKIEAKPGDGKISITWRYFPYTGKESDTTVGFNIYRKKREEKFRKLTPAPVFRVEGSLFYLDENVENGIDYIYGIAAVNIIGVESTILESPVITPVDKTPPLVPMGLTAVDKEEGVLLLWRISPEPDFDYYKILRGDSLRGEYEKINAEKLKEPRFLDRNVPRGKPIYYKVVAVDKSGNSSKPSAAVTIIPKDLIPTGPVSNVEVSIDPETRYAAIRWTAPEDNDIKGYYIYRGSKKEKLLRITDKPYYDKKEPTLFVDKGYRGRGLYPGGNIYYGVSACDYSYNEGEIVIVEAVVPDKVPPHPAYSLSAEVTREGWVHLVWQPSLSRDLATHRIYRRYEMQKEAVLIANIEREVTEYLDKTPDKGKAVIYYLTEVDEVGNESEPTREVRAIPTDIFPPGAPIDLRIVTIGRKIKILWQPPLDDDIVGYNVWVRRKGSKWIRLNKRPIVKLEYLVSHPLLDGIYGVSCIDSSGNEGEKATIIYRGIE